MSHGGVRIIDGEVFNATQEARRIVEEARAQADIIRAEAYSQGVAAAQAATAGVTPGVTPGVTKADDEGRAPAARVGRVREIVGLVVRARMDCDVVLGELVHVCAQAGPVPAEVVAFRERDAVLMFLGHADGVASGARVVASGCRSLLRCGNDLLGRVLDGLGRPVDRGPALAEVDEPWPVMGEPVHALARPPIERVLATGVRAIDGLCTLGRGQRVGLFAGPGSGKSSLLARIARTGSVDVRVVCMVGERSREVREFLEHQLAPHTRARTVAVVATSDAPALVRVRAAHVAMAVAEWFCERQGAHVLVTLDSLTRLARAQREVGLAAGEMPTRHGYPPSVFALLPRLIERAGRFARGSISALFTVLESRADADDPVAEEARATLDGHIQLSREYAAQGRFPAIDILASVSRVMARVASREHLRAATHVRQLLAAYGEGVDLVRMGAYKPGTDAVFDRARAAMGAIDEFRYHDDAESYERCVERLVHLSRSAR